MPRRWMSGAVVKEEDLKPVDVLRYLNDHVIGQEAAKKAISVALRNRWRRKQIAKPDLGSEVC